MMRIILNWYFMTRKFLQHGNRKKTSLGKIKYALLFYDDNLSITDNGTKLVLDNVQIPTPLELNRSTCSIQNYDDNQTSVYSTYSHGNYDNQTFYFSSFDNRTLTNSLSTIPL